MPTQKAIKTAWQIDLETRYTDAEAAAAAASIAGIVPVGGIILWSGTIATIPTHWALCDGNNSTPDLRDQFVVGAKQDDAGTAKTNLTGALTQTGGSISHHHADHVVTQPDNHAALSDHSSDGAHTHDAHTTQTVKTGTEQTPLSGPATHSSDGAHTHNAHDAISAHTGAAVDTHDTLSAAPPYYALAYIMRTS